MSFYFIILVHLCSSQIFVCTINFITNIASSDNLFHQGIILLQSTNDLTWFVFGGLRKHDFKSIVTHDLASELFCCYIMAKLVCAVWNFCSRPVQRWGQQWGRLSEHHGPLTLIDLHKGSLGHIALSVQCHTWGCSRHTPEMQHTITHTFTF